MAMVLGGMPLLLLRGLISQAISVGLLGDKHDDRAARIAAATVVRLGTGSVGGILWVGVCVA